MKKILLVIPVLAVLCGITVLASQADTGTLVSTPAVSQSSAAVTPVVKQESDSPVVVMQDWQETGKKPIRSRFKP
ncbi:hypothetical protein KIH39_20290 [Telmatocola sphagniphila]|jgi:hypothetical protein|uniref:Hepcidin n=1 Tax=Telmatocola sphagniphila TaxID=1123043 RepID=A0A8E6EUB2_9BACT|nr:hypothetical protein [Telmatocola sphagniphila]QVL31165.1 hypothetical protein KIH39_20290 [Telmatocola sphagniphila]